VNLHTYLLTELARAYKAGNMSETVEDKVKATINGVYIKSYTGFRLQGHSVSVQQMAPARPSQNLMKFAGSVHQIFIRKCTKFQDDIFSSF